MERQSTEGSLARLQLRPGATLPTTSNCCSEKRAGASPQVGTARVRQHRRGRTLMHPSRKLCSRVLRRIDLRHPVRIRQQGIRIRTRLQKGRRIVQRLVHSTLRLRCFRLRLSVEQVSNLQRRQVDRECLRRCLRRLCVHLRHTRALPTRQFIRSRTIPGRMNSPPVNTTKTRSPRFDLRSFPRPGPRVRMDHNKRGR